MFSIDKLKGAVATIITPFTQDGGIDEAELRKEIRYLISTEIKGLFPLASTGEYPFMSMAVKEEVIRITAEENKGVKTLICGACGENLTNAMACVALAHKYGYDAVVACPPYYYPQSQPEVYAFYTRLAANAYGMKIIMYNVPFFTSEVSLDTIAKLVDNKNIVGIKDSSGNMKRIRHTVDLKGDREDFIVYSGTDDCLLPALVAGCEGSMTAMGCLLPEAIAEIYKSFYEGDIAKAMEVQKSILPILRQADSLAFPLGYKLIAKLRGMDIGYIHQLCDPAAVAKVEETEKALLEKLLILYHCADAKM